MPPGPPPKPTALKKLGGNPGKRALNPNEPQPDRVMPAMPRGLRRGAKQFWTLYADKLETLGLLTELDGPAFTMMAMHYALAWDAAQILKKDGLMAEDENGAYRKHPMLQVMKDNSRAFLQYAQQFGLTPSARSRLSMPEPPEVDEYEAFLNG